MPPHHCKDFHIEMRSYWATSSSPSCVISPIVSLSPLLSYSPHTCTKNSTISVSTGQSPSTARWCQLKFSSTMRSSSKFNGCLLDPLPGKDSKPTIRKGPLSQLLVWLPRACWDGKLITWLLACFQARWRISNFFSAMDWESVFKGQVQWHQAHLPEHQLTVKSPSNTNINSIGDGVTRVTDWVQVDRHQVPGLCGRRRVATGSTIPLAVHCPSHLEEGRHRANV